MISTPQCERLARGNRPEQSRRRRSHSAILPCTHGARERECYCAVCRSAGLVVSRSIPHASLASVGGYFGQSGSSHVVVGGISAWKRVRRTIGFTIIGASAATRRETRRLLFCLRSACLPLCQRAYVGIHHGRLRVWNLP